MHESARTFLGNALMMLPNYNFAMSISKFFDDYMMKKLCTTHKQFQSIYVNCNKICKYLEFPSSLKITYSFLDFSIYTYIVENKRNLSFLQLR